nr:hypothetical protein [Phytobacter sp. SCO41]
MKMNDRKRIVYPLARQYWRALSLSMHMHEKPCIKRAGVAGLRAHFKHTTASGSVFMVSIMKQRSL